MNSSETFDLDSITFSNNFMFCSVMTSRPDLCKRLIEILLGIKIEKIEEPQYEKQSQLNPVSKTVRYDVFVKNPTQVFDVEIQTTIKSNLAKRTRFYQSVMDGDELHHSMDYNALKDSYVIFICLDDPFGKGRAVYRFENTDTTQKETVKLNDRTFKLFYNASAYDTIQKDSKLKELLSYLSLKQSCGDFTTELDEQVKATRKDERWRKDCMTFEMLVKEEREEAYKKGKAETLRQTALNLLSMGLTPEQAAKGTGLSTEEVLKIKTESETK